MNRKAWDLLKMVPDYRDFNQWAGLFGSVARLLPGTQDKKEGNFLNTASLQEKARFLQAGR